MVRLGKKLCVCVCARAQYVKEYTWRWSGWLRTQTTGWTVNVDAYEEVGCDRARVWRLTSWPPSHRCGSSLFAYSWCVSGPQPLPSASAASGFRNMKNPKRTDVPGWPLWEMFHQISLLVLNETNDIDTRELEQKCICLSIHNLLSLFVL